MRKFLDFGNVVDFRSGTTKPHGAQALWEAFLKNAASDLQGREWREAISNGEKNVSAGRALLLCFGVVLLIPLLVTLVLSLAPLAVILLPPWAVIKVTECVLRVILKPES